MYLREPRETQAIAAVVPTETSPLCPGRPGRGRPAGRGNGYGKSNGGNGHAVADVDWRGGPRLRRASAVADAAGLTITHVENMTSVDDHRGIQAGHHPRAAREGDRGAAAGLHRRSLSVVPADAAGAQRDLPQVHELRGDDRCS